MQNVTQTPDLNARVNILTHDGRFFASEILAFALLYKFGDEPRDFFKIIRNKNIILNTTLRIGVGKKHESNSYNVYSGDYMSMYEHKGSCVRGYFDSTRHDGSKSSAGLIWQELNADIECICDAGSMPFTHSIIGSELHPHIDELVSVVDKHTTGVKRVYDSLFINTIDKLNAVDVHSPEQDQNFETAITFAMSYIECLEVINKNITEKQKDMIGNAIKQFTL